MERKRFAKCLSVLIALSIVLSCVSFSLANVGAATVGEQKDESVSAATQADNFTWDNATVYFLLTDRFKNGNTSNDHSYNRGLDENGNVVSGIDTRGTFHGGDFAGVTQTIEEGYFNDLGVNAIWISAPYEQLHGYVVGGDGSPSFAHYSYHGYYVLDYTQTDANFGTAEEFETLVDTAHEHGLRVILDVVLNHAGYNSTYDMDEYGFGTVKEGWEDSYFSHQNINNSTYHSFIDYDSNASDWAKWWGTDWIRCGVAGYTPSGSDELTMGLAGLPDFKTESNATVDIPPLLKTKWEKEGRLTQETNELKSYLSSKGKNQTVTNSISYWLSTWVREFGVDGFRCDTAKHVELSSWKTLKDTCVDALEEWRENNPNKPGADWDEAFWMTGEHWDHNVGYGVDGYFTQGGFDSMINFETQGGGLFSGVSNVKNIYNGYASAINTKDNFNALSYVSSHDSTLARGNLIQTGSGLLLLPGGVQIFYGDETNRPYVSGIPNDGNGGAGHSLRSDMNWDAIDSNVLSHWQKVGTFRNNHPSVGAGANTDLSSTSGYAFGRTYDKNGISDKVAGCIYANANTDVTIDVSELWADGQFVVNAYDQSSANVQNGKVTFNSGANGTILIQEPDGRPLVSVKGEAKFANFQTLTASLEECETAKVSIDGGNKFVVQNGSTFTIGSTGYIGDKIKVTIEAENEKGTSKSVAEFLKISQEEYDATTVPTTTAPVEKAKLVVKTWDGSAPYAYVWTGENNALLGAWPGTQLTQKDADGNYYVELDTTESYNVVLNNGSGVQSDDITGLNGTATVEVTSSSYSSKIISNGSGGGGNDPVEPTEDSVTIRVKSFDGSAPNLYVWDDTDKSINGAWPGTKLSEKDDDGNYVFVVENKTTVNAIVNNGSGQTADITGITGDVTITITDANCTAYKMEKNETPLSGAALLRKEAREVKAMTASDFTPASWSTVQELMPAVDTVVMQGSLADEATIQSTLTQLQNAKSKLVLVNPKYSYLVAGNKSISGVAVPDAKVTVTIGSNKYTTSADDVTGAFNIYDATVTSTSIVKADVERNGYSSASYTYNMANGNIISGEEPTNPTIPTGTDPITTEPITTAPVTTQPVTTEPVTTQPTTTEPATEPTTTEPEKSTLDLTATSNLFPKETQTVFLGYDEPIKVIFQLDSSMKVVNAQWTLTYDPNVLAISDKQPEAFMPLVDEQVINIQDGVIYGNFSEVSAPYEFNGEDEFVAVYFDVLNPCDTTVDLNVEELSVGTVKGGVLSYKNAIVNSKLVDLSAVQGYKDLTITGSTVIDFIAAEITALGDVNGDGFINVTDATLISKSAAGLITFTDEQFEIADVNGDGYVNVNDATLIQKYAAQIITKF